MALLNQIKANEATVSSLYADNIISKEGSFTDIMAQKISGLRDEIKATLNSMAGTTTPTPDLNYSLLDQSTSWMADIASDSATITGNLSLTDNMVIGGQLAVAGQTQLASALITGQLQVGQLQMTDTKIETLASALYIQPAATGSVHIMGDTLVIAENGQVQINGDLALTGKITATDASVSGNLATYLLTATDATISGTLKTNTLETDNLKIAAAPAVTIASPEIATPSATQAAVSSNTVAGTATLPAGATELVVYNPKLSTSSMVYLTPVGSTNNQVLYLKDKTISPTPTAADSTPSATPTPASESRFTIALDQPLDHSVEINWWIIN
jgi:cytoskeletal protein CcmA (bactofilin family)